MSTHRSVQPSRQLIDQFNRHVNSLSCQVIDEFFPALSVILVHSTCCSLYRYSSLRSSLPRPLQPRPCIPSTHAKFESHAGYACALGMDGIEGAGISQAPITESSATVLRWFHCDGIIAVVSFRGLRHLNITRAPPIPEHR